MMQPLRSVTLEKCPCPALYSQTGAGEAAVAHMRFVCPSLGWVWYATEYDHEDGRFFGLVFGACAELGYFSADELAEGGVEVDLAFVPAPLSEIRTRHADA